MTEKVSLRDLITRISTDDAARTAFGLDPGAYVEASGWPADVLSGRDMADAIALSRDGLAPELAARLHEWTTTAGLAVHLADDLGDAIGQLEAFATAVVTEVGLDLGADDAAGLYADDPAPALDGAVLDLLDRPALPHDATIDVDDVDDIDGVEGVDDLDGVDGVDAMAPLGASLVDAAFVDDPIGLHDAEPDVEALDHVEPDFGDLADP